MTKLSAADKDALVALCGACHVIGQEIPRWTQGAGGNVSQKSGGSLWIKASGCRLDQVGASSTTLARLDLAALRLRLAADKIPRRAGPTDASTKEAAAEQSYADALAALSDPAFGRASMESGFHALLSKAFVAHFHALSALVMACVAKSQPARWADFCKAQASEMPVRLEFVRPGLLLSHAVANLPPFEVCLLENHGVILHADSSTVLSRWAAFEQAFCMAWGLPQLASGGAPLPLSAYRHGPWKILFPDAVVFCDRIMALAQVSESGDWHMPEDAMARDQAAAELWVATQVLQRAWPTMAALPADVARSLTHMPTELWRQKQQSSPSLSP